MFAVGSWSLQSGRRSIARQLLGGVRWELVALVALVALGSQLITEPNRGPRGGTAMLVPILLIAVGATAAVRLLAIPVSRARRARRIPRDTAHLIGWLARRRVIHAIAEASALVVVVATGVGMHVYASSYDRTGADGLDAKAASLAGARSTVSIGWSGEVNGERDGLPGELPAGTAVVWRDSNVRVGPQLVVDLLIVDPQTFVGAAAWRPSFADRSLAAVLASISEPRPGAVGIVAAGPSVEGVPERGTLTTGLWTVPYELIDRIESIPGRNDRATMVMIDAASMFEFLGDENPTVLLEGREELDGWFRTEFWSDAGPEQFVEQLIAVGLDRATVEEAQFGGIALELRRPSFVAFGSSRDYLRLVGAAALAVGALSLLLGAARRAPGTAVELAMLRKMGVPRRALVALLLAEQLVLAAVAGLIGVVLGGATIELMAGRTGPRAPPRPPAGAADRRRVDRRRVGDRTRRRARRRAVGPSPRQPSERQRGAPCRRLKRSAMRPRAVPWSRSTAPPAARSTPCGGSTRRFRGG